MVSKKYNLQIGSAYVIGKKGKWKTRNSLSPHTIETDFKI